MQFICSYVLYPLAIMIGVQSVDCRKVAELIGIKTFLSEFIAYDHLRRLITNRENLESHVAQNGTWHWSGDDVIMTHPGRNDTVDILLQKGFISVNSISFRRFDTTLTGICIVSKAIWYYVAKEFSF